MSKSVYSLYTKRNRKHVIESHLRIKLIRLSSKDADLQVFTTCWLNESKESNVTPRSRNIGTKLITVSLILIDLGKCTVAIPCHTKSMALVLSLFICSLLWTSMSLHLKCTVLCYWLCLQFQMVCTICTSVCHLHTFDEKLDNVLWHLIEAVYHRPLA